MNITPLFATPAEGSPLTPMGANGNINISIRKNINGAVININGIGANQEFSLERVVNETDLELAIRAKSLITNSIEVA